MPLHNAIETMAILLKPSADINARERNELADRLDTGLESCSDDTLRQALFFVKSIVSGCYLIYITNTYGSKTPTISARSSVT